jgi:23S rRNA (cytidine1920-2'-O)/16S rRNA (cytidine1409-2'-O)-methyltransferase
LESGDLPLPAYDLVTLDLSFISLRKVLQRAWSFLRPGGKLIALIKPQFEATKKEANAGRGIIRDPEIHDRVVKDISSFADNELERSLFIGCMESPLRGAEGNVEFLLGWEKGPSEG